MYSQGFPSDYMPFKQRPEELKGNSLYHSYEMHHLVPDIMALFFTCVYLLAPQQVFKTLKGSSPSTLYNLTGVPQMWTLKEHLIPDDEYKHETDDFLSLYKCKISIKVSKV